MRTSCQAERDWLNSSSRRTPVRDQIPHSPRRAGAGDRARKESARKGSTPLRPQYQNAHRRAVAAKALIEFGVEAGRHLRLVAYGKLARTAARRLVRRTTPGEGAEGAVASVVKRVFGTGEEKIKVPGIDDIMVFRARCQSDSRRRSSATSARKACRSTRRHVRIVNLCTIRAALDVEWDKGTR